MKTPSSRNRKTKQKKQQVTVDQNWSVLHPDAAGIDLGAREHWVALPPGRAEQTVRPFGTTTPDLDALALWLQEHGVTHVAMEATGVYWIAVFQLLERKGFQVLLVNARQIKNVSGRKSDVLDCQWIQRLHAYGLLGGSFRPADAYCVVRSYVRYRDELIAARSVQIQHMQKALLQMNLQLSAVLSDLSGESGQAIIGAILKGERNPVSLAALAHRRVKSSQEQIAKALVGNYRAEHLFVLQTAYDLFLNYESKIAACDEQLTMELAGLPDRVDPSVRPLPAKAKGKKIEAGLREALYRKLGADLTALEGVGPTVALTVLTEVGPELSAFPSEKHFSSWLGLCPDHRISGGKILSRRTRRVVHRLSDVLRLAATALEHSASALGVYYRRMKAKLGAAEAITATAHKLARVIYRLLRHGEDYVRRGLEEEEQKYQERKLTNLKRTAAALGFDLVEKPTFPAAVS